jgi:hypothetical protein
MLRRVGLVETDVSEERVASIFRVEEITERGQVLNGCGYGEWVLWAIVVLQYLRELNTSGYGESFEQLWCYSICGN